MNELFVCRDVWPEGDVFGPEDADPEDEFMALREILFAEIEEDDEGLAEEDEARNEEGANPHEGNPTEEEVIYHKKTDLGH